MFNRAVLLILLLLLLLLLALLQSIRILRRGRLGSKFSFYCITDKYDYQLDGGEDIAFDFAG